MTHERQKIAIEMWRAFAWALMAVAGGSALVLILILVVALEAATP